MSQIRDVTVEALDLPLTEPFEIALGTQKEANNVLVRVTTESGTVGTGEGSPLASVTGEGQAAALATAKTVSSLLVGEEVGEYRRLSDRLHATCPGMTTAIFAVETAVLDAYCRENELAMSELFGGSPSPVDTDLTVPIKPPDTAREIASRAVSGGFNRLKVKCGSDVAADVERVVAAADGAPGAELLVDANQGWTSKETERFATAVADEGVELVLIEQPVRKDDLAGLADCRTRVDVPIAADEAVFSPADALQVVRAEAADVINVKLGKAGPVRAAAIVSIAEAANLELMIGCFLESSIGIHTSAHVVSGSGAFSHVDLDGNLLLDEDVIDRPYGSRIDVAGPGHGITVE